MQTIHWNFFFAVEDDLASLSRYVEFHEDNFRTYSIEIARILMTAVQEVDVVLKSICAHYGGNGTNIRDYHDLILPRYPNLRDARVTLMHYSLARTPFAIWSEETAPPWWTANNKVKHARDKEFARASLENAIDAVGALLIVNMYRHEIVEGVKFFHMDRIPRLFDIGWFGRGVGGYISRRIYWIPKE